VGGCGSTEGREQGRKPEPTAAKAGSHPRLNGGQKFLSPLKGGGGG